MKDQANIKKAMVILSCCSPDRAMSIALCPVILKILVDESVQIEARAMRVVVSIQKAKGGLKRFERPRDGMFRSIERMIEERRRRSGGWLERYISAAPEECTEGNTTVRYKPR
jgi:hypothetical protein